MDKNKNHLVLGGAGAIGGAVIKELRSRDLPTKALELNKKLINVETINANLLDLERLNEAIYGTNYVYLCVGLPYKSDVWLRDWPMIMDNVITACSQNQAKLIFFDNTYMYGEPPLPNPFTESTSQNPVTKKGLARKTTTDKLLEAINLQKIEAVIGRSTDFYGPQAINSPFYISFLERMLQNKNPQSIYPKGVPHNYAYTEDNGRALVDLAFDDSAYGEVWHLPAGEEITLDEVLEIFNRHLGSNFEISYLSKPVINLLSLFVANLREAKEMIYQFEKPHIISADKFKNKFPDFETTDYETGILKMIDSFRG